MNPSVLHQRLTTDQRMVVNRDSPADHSTSSPLTVNRERSSLGTILKKTLERREKRKISEPIFYSNRHAIINASTTSAVPFGLTNGNNGYLVAHNSSNNSSHSHHIAPFPVMSKGTPSKRCFPSDVPSSGSEDDPMSDPFKQQVTMMLERTKEKKIPDPVPVPSVPTVITVVTTSTPVTCLTPVCVPFAVSSGPASSIVSAMEICSTESCISSLSPSVMGLHKEQQHDQQQQVKSEGKGEDEARSGTKVKQALQILPDYLPYLTSSSSSACNGTTTTAAAATMTGMTASGSATRITLMGPIVFPVLERILSEDKDMIEFQVKDPSSEIHVKGSSPSSASSLLRVVNITPTPVLLTSGAAAAAAAAAATPTTASRNSPVLVMQPRDHREETTAAVTAKSEPDDDCAMNVDAEVTFSEGENVSIRLQEGEEDRDTRGEKDECVEEQEEAKLVTGMRNNGDTSAEQDSSSNPDTEGDSRISISPGGGSGCGNRRPVVRIKREEVDICEEDVHDDREGEKRELFPPQTTSEGRNQRSRPTSLAFLSPTGTSAATGASFPHQSRAGAAIAAVPGTTTTSTSVAKAADERFTCSDSENLSSSSSSDSFTNSCSNGSQSNSGDQHLNPSFNLIASNIASPDTPRPDKSILQQYLNGHAYTYIGLKTSTRSTYCCIYRPQPMFVTQETDSKLSMYSNWRTSSHLHDAIISDVSPRGLLSSYDSNLSRFKDSISNVNPAYYVLSGSKIASLTPDHLTMTTDSQYWVNESKKMASLDESLQMLVDDTNRKMSNCEVCLPLTTIFPVKKYKKQATSTT